jgi:hypothetical protein
MKTFFIGALIFISSTGLAAIAVYYMARLVLKPW